MKETVILEILLSLEIFPSLIRVALMLWLLRCLLLLELLLLLHYKTFIVAVIWVVVVVGSGSSSGGGGVGREGLSGGFIPRQAGDGVCLDEKKDGVQEATHVHFTWGVPVREHGQAEHVPRHQNEFQELVQIEYGLEALLGGVGRR